MTFFSSLFFGVLCLALLFRTHSVGAGAEPEGNGSPLRAALNSGSVELDAEKGRFTARIPNGGPVALTVDPAAQKMAEALLVKYDPTLGAVVLMEAKTGAVRVMAQYRRNLRSHYLKNDGMTFLESGSRSASYPMASLAKIAAAAAAFEAGAYHPGSRFHCNGSFSIDGGGRLSDPVGVRHGDLSLTEAFAKSCNPSFSQVAREVGGKKLQEMFDRMLFNRVIDFDLPVAESLAAIGPEQGDAERAGSGFAGAFVSPLHAVMIAGAAANEGRMMRPYLAERGQGSSFAGKPRAAAQPFSKATAAKIRDMMWVTVQKGSARKGFFDAKGRYLPGEVKVGGKTGSLSGDGLDEKYTWFIGVTDEEEPRAIAVMIVNDLKWNIKAASFSGRFFQELQALKRNS